MLKNGAIGQDFAFWFIFRCFLRVFGKNHVHLLLSKNSIMMSTEPKNTSVPEEQVGVQNAEDTIVATPVSIIEKQEDNEDENSAGVDFSDEEASLAASAPEFDLGDDNEEIDSNSSEEKEGQPGIANYTGKSEAELVAAFAELLETKPVQLLRRDADAIKIAFYKARRSEVEAQRLAFVAAGGDIESFVATEDANEVRLKQLFAEYRAKRNEFVARIDQEKEVNYKIKLQIIEELKDLVGSNETMNQTFNTFRELQQRWKDTGAVPVANVKDLWETYNLHVENFYNFIKINKELRDLDLKKNYEAKLHLCEESERLVLDPAIVDSFHKLQKLHDRWRETGPVANEYKEQLWERFREASSKINKRHQEHFENVKDEQKRNMELKAGLCEKTEELSNGILSTRKEWTRASEQLIEIQKVWKTIGFAPKKDNTKIYERFRNACDRFFENKRNFYLSAKAEMDNNLILKNEICAQAEAIKDGEDWKKATDELIALQKRWKEIGPVSRRYSDAVWKRFRTACDSFFERKSEHFSKQENSYEKNLEKKKELLEELRNFKVEDRESGFEGIKNIQRRWSEIGFVPIKQKDAIQAEYRKIVDGIFAELRGNERERKLERFKGKISNMGEGGERRVRHERDRLYNKMKQMETDIALLENNIGFFSRSKNAEQVIRDVKEQIVKLKEEMGVIVEKINLIDKQGE